MVVNAIYIVSIPDFILSSSIDFFSNASPKTISPKKFSMSKVPSIMIIIAPNSSASTKGFASLDRSKMSLPSHIEITADTSYESAAENNLPQVSVRAITQSKNRPLARAIQTRLSPSFKSESLMPKLPNINKHIMMIISLIS